ncbi:MAG: hypothetical protein K8R31_07275 [Bacteroidales bacterium]|nr:hypothetical protein [Bacteroidales bacterium]
MRSFIFLLFIMLTFSLKGQDVIKTVFGDEINAKVIGVSEGKLKYQKTNDPNNAKYSMDVTKIDEIIFEDGTIKKFGLEVVDEEFNGTEIKMEGINEEKIPEILYSIAGKGNKVFLQSHDDNAIVHVKNAIEPWGYWEIASDDKQADFILKFYLRYEGAGVCIVNAAFVDPKTNDVLYSTREVTSVKGPKGFDFNTKRSAMRQIVEQIFKPNFK